jgi:hypothetical protein
MHWHLPPHTDFVFVHHSETPCREFFHSSFRGIRISAPFQYLHIRDISKISPLFWPINGSVSPLPHGADRAYRTRRRVNAISVGAHSPPLRRNRRRSFNRLPDSGRAEKSDSRYAYAKSSCHDARATATRPPLRIRPLPSLPASTKHANSVRRSSPFTSLPRPKLARRRHFHRGS